MLGLIRKFNFQKTSKQLNGNLHRT